MKIYTKGGDRGETSLLGGKRVSKSSVRLSAYGTIDELHSFMGLLRSKLDDKETKQFIYKISQSMISVGGILATPPDYQGKQVEFDTSLIGELETRIDEIGSKLPPFKSFIVYGDNEVSSIAHICRSVARRAERVIVEMAEEEPVREDIIIYINRLSDYFFMLALKLSENHD